MCRFSPPRRSVLVCAVFRRRAVFPGERAGVPFFRAARGQEGGRVGVPGGGALEEEGGQEEGGQAHAHAVRQLHAHPDE